MTAGRLVFLGHSTVVVERPGTVVITDPVLRNRVAFLRWTAAEQAAAFERGAATSAGTEVAVLISHLHHDHCDLPSLRRLAVQHGKALTLLVPDGSESFFLGRRLPGVAAVVPMAPGRQHEVGALRITATYAEHDGRRARMGPRYPALGYTIEAAVAATDGADVPRTYFAGDTDLFPGMDDIGPVDLALLPVSGWGRTMGPGHLDPHRAAEAAFRLQAARAIPIHWGGLQPAWQRRDPWHVASRPAAQFASAIEKSRKQPPADAPPVTTAVVLEPGAEMPW